MLKQLLSFLKILWKNIWPTAKIGKLNYLKTVEEYYGITFPSQSKKLMQKYGIIGGISAGLACHIEEDNKPKYIVGYDPFKDDMLMAAAYAAFIPGKYIPQLSGDVSEQSVILRMMDEVYETTLTDKDLNKMMKEFHKDAHIIVIPDSHYDSNKGEVASDIPPPISK